MPTQEDQSQTIHDSFQIGVGGPILVNNSGALKVTDAEGAAAALTMDKTITAIGTTGARTINNPMGSANVAVGAASIVITNSLVTANSIVMCSVGTADATFTFIKSVVAGDGTITVTGNATATAATRINFVVFN